MSSHHIVTAEELACLLASSSAADRQSTTADKTEALLAQGGAGLWLVKGLFLYMALQMLGLQSLPIHYLWARCALEVLCCAVFWSTLRQPERRGITLGALLVGTTTLLMDMLMLFALPV